MNVASPYRSKDLFYMIKKIGLAKNPKLFIMYRMKKNRFSPPRTIKRRGVKPRWCFSEEQLIDIMKSFLPGGSGEWHYVKEKRARRKTDL